MGTHFSHLSFTDRLKIESWLRVGVKPREMAEMLHCSRQTIYNELKRGTYEHLDSEYRTEIRYSPDKAETRYRINLQAKGGQLKIGNDHKLAKYIEDKILKENYSPAAVLGEIRTSGAEFKTTICVSTLYSYIDKGVFLKLTNKNLPVKRNKTNGYKKVKRAAKAPKGDSIEHRPAEVDTRERVGDWEMDCVEGKKKTKKTLLVLTERKTRKEIIRLMPDKTAASVVTALDKLERRLGATMFQKTFRSITMDNGCEFSDCAGIEKSCITGQQRTKAYYCHPYSSYERGSNENQNKMVRRKYPKGYDFSKTSAKAIQMLENWINNYPRKIFNFETAEMRYKKACKEEL